MFMEENLLVRTDPPSRHLEGDIFQTDTDSDTDFRQDLNIPSSGEASFMDKSAKYPYRLATLNDRGGDPIKRWSITFYVWHTGHHKLVRKQLWISAKFTTKAQKQAEAVRKIRGINELLAKGYHLGAAPAKAVPKKDNWTVLQAIDWVKERKSPGMRTRSIQSFQLFRTEFERWLGIQGMDRLPLALLTFDHLDSYMHWVRMERGIGNETFNNYLNFIKLTFNHLVKSGKLDFSPAAKLERLKTEQPTNVSFPAPIKAKLLAAYQEQSPELAFFAQYIYYSFIRPKELRLLRVSHILDKTIFIPGTISKNRKSEHVLISPALERLIGSLGVRQAPAHYYLIGHDGKPSARPVSPNFYTSRHLEIRRALQLPELYTLYCWKHTGVTDTYQQTLDIEFVSRQCRHSSLDMTKRYLRGLGLLREYPLQGQLPDLGL
jgi:integrase